MKSLALAAFCITLTASAAPVPQTLAGWKMELVAESPQLNHPSVVCCAPDGRVFVAEDPMDIREDVAASAKRGRILCFQPDGKVFVFADQLHAVFGMQYLEGKLYVLHNPQFSVFTDDHGTGRERRDLIEQTLPEPWALEWNEHVPANFRLGMDGFFYIAVGDKGLYGARGTDGRRLDLKGGDIVRIRPDGTDLELFSTGVRNILDVAINVEDEIFTYDNTDEINWMGRLTHMVDRGEYGYPYDFNPRQPHTLWMMHDFGGGSATGMDCYLGDVLPEEYRDNLFLADFGKRQVMRVPVRREGATYRVSEHEELFPSPPEDFRPVGIAWSADERSLYICDWQHRDTKANVEVGRLWKATFTNTTAGTPKPSWYLPAAMGQAFEAGNEELIAALGHPSRTVRLTAQRQLQQRKASTALATVLVNSAALSIARQHALWALDGMDGGQSTRASIIALVSETKDLALSRQAMRQLGLRRTAAAVPALSATVGDPNADPSLRFHGATALGRIADPGSVSALLAALAQNDSFARFAAFTALNRIGSQHPEVWKRIAGGLVHESPVVRDATVCALRETYDETLVAVLAKIARSPGDCAAREAALGLLGGIYRKFPQWKGEWWSYHPVFNPAPVKSVAWAVSGSIVAALSAGIRDSEISVRLAAVASLQAAGASECTGSLREQFARETDECCRRDIMRALVAFKDPGLAEMMIGILRNPPPDANLVAEAIQNVGQIGGEACAAALLDLVRTGHPARASAIAALAPMRRVDAIPVLTSALADSDEAVRIAAILALGEISTEGTFVALQPFAQSPALNERAAAVKALGNSPSPAALPLLLVLWKWTDTRDDAFAALVRHPDARALDVYLEGLASPRLAVRTEARKALGVIREEVLVALESRAGELAASVIAELREIYKDHDTARKGALFATTGKVLTVEDYSRSALAAPGDPVRGQRVFHEVGCISCHAVAGYGNPIGPEMTTIGAQLPQAELIDSILYPSKKVRDGYQISILETLQGGTLSGMIKSETGESISLVDAAGVSMTIFKKDLKNRIASPLSLMPAGLHAGLTLEQFTDLTAYLESLKSDRETPRSACAGSARPPARKRPHPVP